VYEISAFEPNIVEPRGATAGGLAGAGAVVSPVRVRKEEEASPQI
jgi:hypothetical protein